MKNRKGGTFRRRLLIVFLVYIVANFLFNVLFFFLSVRYLQSIQDIPSSFNIWSRFNIREGLIKEEVNKDMKAANKEYLKALKNLSDQEQIAKYDEKSNDFIILPMKTLKSKNDLRFVGGYCDLLLRYALTHGNDQETEFIINQTLDIIKEFEGNPKVHDIGSYNLKNNALRTLASIMESQVDSGKFFKDEKKIYEKIEAYYINAVKLLIDKEHLQFEKDEFGVVPKNTMISDNLLSSLLDLSLFYIDSKKDINKSLSILLSVLRSLQFKEDKLLSLKSSSQDFKRESELNALKNEKIPLLKSNIAEILWSKKLFTDAIKFSQESCYESLISSKDNYNSAKISKNCFKNLYRMYEKLGDLENAKTFYEKYKEINIPYQNDARLKREKLRDVVLYHYFGNFGRILFP
ncbi:hypothetical protein PACTADRAFT_185778 [Pachysolen tannophilus NRRL Y-2460]|uniref:Uncharacterized protein n=1 Tax=Pachysolen tannophilus NRRL Y-2460 TaxID=669874 RepID=A0A1E4U1N8_PACTA|nr:hypothetical protein PACTADRAFT_185778 [Pachysolen tannophilus NRRL Y-2460]